MKLQIILNEMRSNPQLNPRTSIKQRLDQYIDVPDVFISFGSVNKVGINPSTRFETPNGFYCYPSEFIVDNIQYMPLSQARPFPSQHDSLYVLVVKVINKTNVFDVDDDISPRLRNQINNNPFFKNKDTDLLQTVGDLWNNVEKILREKSTGSGEHRRADFARNSLQIFRQLQIDGITDTTGRGIIHPAERHQAVFFNMRCLHQIDTLYDEDDKTNNVNVPFIPVEASPTEIINMMHTTIARSPITQDNFKSLITWYVHNFARYCFKYPSLIRINGFQHNLKNAIKLAIIKSINSAYSNDEQLMDFLDNMRSNDILDLGCNEVLGYSWNLFHYKPETANKQLIDLIRRPSRDNVPFLYSHKLGLLSKRNRRTTAWEKV